VCGFHHDEAVAAKFPARRIQAHPVERLVHPRQDGDLVTITYETQYEGNEIVAFKNLPTSTFQRRRRHHLKREERREWERKEMK
jgi:hypothetical protein